MGYMGLLLGGCIYLLRVDFSMAMVCMVKPADTVIRNGTASSSLIFTYTKDIHLLEDNITAVPLGDADCVSGVQEAEIAQQVGTKLCAQLK